MEIQFQKSVFPCLKTVCRQYLSQEQTQEVRIPDGMPDIGTVLAAWGQVVIRGKEWHASNASVTGGVMVWVLYLPEDGSEVQQLETWLPFQQIWDFPETPREGNLQVIPMLRSVDARTLSARKMMVRTSVGMLGHATVPDELELYTPEQLPEDIQILQKTYPLRLQVESGEKAFHLEESLSVPAANVPIERILRYWLHPSISETKVVADKLVLRGIAGLSALYRGTDGQLHTWEFDLPFSQYTQLDRDYAPEAQADVYFVVTSLELEPGEGNSLNLKAGLSGQYTLFDTAVVEIPQDAYSLTQKVTPLSDKIDIPAILDSRGDTVTAQQNMQADMIRIVDVAFYPENPSVQHQEDLAQAVLAGTFHVLGYSPDGELQTATARWENILSIGADENVVLEMTVLPVGRATGNPGAGDVSLTAQMQVQINSVFAQMMEYLTGLETGEIIDPDPNRPSLVLRRAGKDSLWEIAKAAGSTVADIQKANNLQTEPEQNKLLLIPIR